MVALKVLLLECAFSYDGYTGQWR